MSTRKKAKRSRRFPDFREALSSSRTELEKLRAVVKRQEAEVQSERARLDQEAMWIGQVRQGLDAAIMYLEREDARRKTADVVVISGESTASAEVKPSTGIPTLRSAVVQALKSASEPLHVKQIWERARGLGAQTKNKSPENAVYLALGDMMKSDIPLVERTGPGTFRYIEKRGEAPV